MAYVLVRSGSDCDKRGWEEHGCDQARHPTSETPLCPGAMEVSPTLDSSPYSVQGANYLRHISCRPSAGRTGPAAAPVGALPSGDCLCFDMDSNRSGSTVRK